MSFSDPFNRVACRQDSEFHKFQEQLQQAGIDTEEKAYKVLRESRRNMLTFCVIVVVSSLIVSLIWPQMAGIIVVFSGLILLWLLITLARGQRMMKLYIKQGFIQKPKPVLND